MTKTEIATLIAAAPKNTAEMLANRASYLIREALKGAGKTPVDFADFLGMSRAHVVSMVEGKVIATEFDVSAAYRFVGAA